jgi:CHAD domain-containing protein
MRDYARRQTALLLRRLAAALNRAARAGDAESIHDVRVAMRRLSRCLRVFAPFYPNRSGKKLRRQLASLMETAGAVRDCDIAIDLLAQAGVPRRESVVARLEAERRRAGRDLQLQIRRWKNRDSLRQWRSRLEV